MIPNKKLNGSHKQQKPEQVEFPVSYILKVVLTMSTEGESSEKQIESILLRLKIPFSFVEVKMSSRQTYISHSIRVTLLDKAQMDDLYEALRQLPGIKLAI